MDHITEAYAMVTDALHEQEDGLEDFVDMVAVMATAREDIYNVYSYQF